MSDMYLKLGPDYVDPVTQSPLPDAVLEVLEFRPDWLVNSDALRVGVWANEAAWQQNAQRVSDSTTQLSAAEIQRYRPLSLRVLLSLLADRPEFAGSTVIVDSPPTVPSNAALVLGSLNAIKQDVVAIIPVTSSQVSGASLQMSGGTLMTAGGGRFALAAMIPLGNDSGDGQILVNGSPVSSVASLSENGQNVARPSFGGDIPSGATIEAAFYNSTNGAASVSAGGTLSAATAE